MAACAGLDTIFDTRWLLRIPDFGRWFISREHGSETAWFGTFPTFARDIPSGSSHHKPTFNIRLIGMVARQKLAGCRLIASKMKLREADIETADGGIT